MWLVIWFAVLVASLAVLIKGADVFVERAAELARTMHISDVVIGVTLVALGTSLPELAASLASVFKGAGEFVAGTVVGSNVANITFILGTAALLFRGFTVSPQLLRVDLPVMVLAAFMLTLMGFDGSITRLEGLLLLAMYGVYLGHIIREQKATPHVEEATPLRPVVIVWLVAGGAAVYLGAVFTVRAVSELTVLLGLGDTSLLALSIVAVGSSLPELVVTLQAARKGYHDLSVGNIVGSNICNSFLVTGAPALIQPLPVSPAVVSTGLPFMVAVTVLLVIFSQRGVMARYAGIFFLLIFAFFIARTWGVM